MQHLSRWLGSGLSAGNHQEGKGPPGIRQSPGGGRPVNHQEGAGPPGTRQSLLGKSPLSLLSTSVTPSSPSCSRVTLIHAPSSPLISPLILPSSLSPCRSCHLHQLHPRSRGHVTHGPRLRNRLRYGLLHPGGRGRLMGLAHGTQDRQPQGVERGSAPDGHHDVSVRTAGVGSSVDAT